MKPQQTRCQEWNVGWHRVDRCRKPITHRIVGRWMWYPYWPERVLVCAEHAKRMAKVGDFVSITAYRVRKGNR